MQDFQELFGLPKITNFFGLTNALNISDFNLYKIVNHPELFYKKVEIPKKTEGLRILACPSYRLKAVQAWVLRNILEKVPIHKNAMAYTTKSLDENVNKHVGNKFLLCMDVKNFFPATKSKRVYEFFKSIGYNKQVSVMFTKICTFEKGLPQGGVTSPSLSNLLNKDLDQVITNHCNQKGIIYTRYADDITISSNNISELKLAKHFIRDQLEKYSYYINSKKTRLLRPGNKRKITGLIYNDQLEVRIGSKQKKLLRAKIHHYETKKFLDVNERRKLYDHINGWLAFLFCVDKKTYYQLRNYWDKLCLHQTTIIETAVSNDDDCDDGDNKNSSNL